MPARRTRAAAIAHACAEPDRSPLAGWRRPHSREAAVRMPGDEPAIAACDAQFGTGAWDELTPNLRNEWRRAHGVNYSEDPQP